MSVFLSATFYDLFHLLTIQISDVKSVCSVNKLIYENFAFAFPKFAFKTRAVCEQKGKRHASVFLFTATKIKSRGWGSHYDHLYCCCYYYY